MIMDEQMMGSATGHGEGMDETLRAVLAAAGHFLPDGKPTVRTGRSGFNNITRIIESEGTRHVLRIYRTHRDREKVLFEHDLLDALCAMDLPFRVPEPVRTLDGCSVAELENGDLAAMFGWLPGDRPEWTSIPSLRSFGRVAGQLQMALAQVSMTRTPAYRPYYELCEAYPACTPDKMAVHAENPPAELADLRTDLRTISRKLLALGESVSTLRGLPHQLIHGDLNASNVLADSNGIVDTVLDFEFGTFDLRAMEVAVCLSELLHDSGEGFSFLHHTGTFLDGFAESASLTAEEAAQIPLLLLLRRLDVVLHFWSRWEDGKDSVTILRQQIQQAAAQVCWLEDHGDELLRMVGRLVR